MWMLPKGEGSRREGRWRFLTHLVLAVGMAGSQAFMAEAGFDSEVAFESRHRISRVESPPVERRPTRLPPPRTRRLEPKPPKITATSASTLQKGDPGLGGGGASKGKGAVDFGTYTYGVALEPKAPTPEPAGASPSAAGIQQEWADGEATQSLDAEDGGGMGTSVVGGADTLSSRALSVGGGGSGDASSLRMGRAVTGSSRRRTPKVRSVSI